MRQYPGLRGQGHDCIVISKWLSDLCDRVRVEVLKIWRLASHTIYWVRSISMFWWVTSSHIDILYSFEAWPIPTATQDPDYMSLSSSEIHCWLLKQLFPEPLWLWSLDPGLWGPQVHWFGMGNHWILNSKMVKPVSSFFQIFNPHS